MNANEIVRALRNCGGGPEGMKITHDAADLIESLQAVGSANYWKSAWEAQCAENKKLYEALAESQRRERAAVEDLSTYKDCGFCAHLQDQQYCYKNCQRHVDVDNFRTHPCWQWRGLQEVEAEREKGCEYCRGNVKELVDGDTTIFINHEDKVFYADWSGSDYLDWKHCPMCGRRLEVDHEQ